MLDPTEQRSRLAQIVTAAKAEDCLVAPVGSVYFLLRGTGRQYTKDIDTVIHEGSLEPASLATLRRVADRLGSSEVSVDGGVVNVRTSPEFERADVELIRGRSARKGGFFPRGLLLRAARLAKREGNVLIYPLEAVLVLKADAALDREERAQRDPNRAERHSQRAAVFRADVFGEVGKALQTVGLRRELLNEFVDMLKEKRRAGIRSLLATAGAKL